MKRIMTLGAMAAALSIGKGLGAGHMTLGPDWSDFDRPYARQYRPPSAADRLYEQQRAEARAKKAKQRKQRKVSRS